MLFRQARNWNFLTAAAVLLLSLLSTQIRAEKSQNLYEVLVPVLDQTSATREQAFQQVFDGVVRKLTGRDDIATSTKLSGFRAKAGTYVSQFHYQERSVAEQTAPDEAHYLRVRFNESAINQILRQHNLPLWGADRPSMLIWVAQDIDGQRSIVTPLDFAPVRDEMTLAADNWGIPAVYPVMDFDDIGALSLSELWGLFQEPVERASKRYGANAVMAMRVWTTDKNLWSGRTLFLLNGQIYTKSYENVSPTALANAAMADVAKHMFDMFAVSAGSAADEPVTVIVDNVKSVRDYARLMNSLDSLTAVRHVAMAQVDGSRIMLRVTIDGTLQQFGHAIETVRKLRVVSTPVHAPVYEDMNVIDNTSTESSTVAEHVSAMAEPVSGVIVEDRSIPASEIRAYENEASEDSSEMTAQPVEVRQLSWAADLYYHWQ